MGKGGGGRSGGGRSGGSKPTQTRPSQRPATTNAPQTRPNPPPQQTPPQAHAPQSGGGGMGMMGTIGSVAAGSIIGHVVADKFLGGGSGESQGQQQQNFQESPCFQFRSTFDTCLLQNQDSISKCQNNWDSYRSCMTNPNSQNNWS